MTIYEALSVGVSAVGLIAVVLSLWLLRRQVIVMSGQTAHLRQTIEVSAESAVDSIWAVVTQAYLAYPELRLIFNENESPSPVAAPTGEARLRASALAELIVDSIERVLRFEDDGVPGPADSMDAWICDAFRYSKFLRDWLHAHRAWYSPRLSSVLDASDADAAGLAVVPIATR